jgi:hypothetical protein
MLEDLAHSWYGFWAIAFVIVVLDSAVLLAPGEFAFSFDKDGRPRLRVPAAPFVMRGKDLLFASLEYFARPFFVSSIASSLEADEAPLQALRHLSARCRAMCAYSYVAAAVLVVVGPIVAFNAGISVALVVALPIIYLNAVVALLAVFTSRADFGLSPTRFGSLAFELLVCPVLIMNLNKRLIDRGWIVPNTLSLIRGDDALLRRVNQNLDYHGVKAQ